MVFLKKQQKGRFFPLPFAAQWREKDEDVMWSLGIKSKVHKLESALDLSE